MEKQKTEILITVVLVVVFILFLVATVSRLHKKSSEKETAAKESASLSQSSIAQGKLPEKKTFEDIQWGRDPFILRQQKIANTETPFILTAVIWDEKEPTAVINGQIITAGQQIDGYQVVNIFKDNVILIKDGKELTLYLYD